MRLCVRHDSMLKQSCLGIVKAFDITPAPRTSNTFSLPPPPAPLTRRRTASSPLLWCHAHISSPASTGSGAHGWPANPRPLQTCPGSSGMPPTCLQTSIPSVNIHAHHTS